jgi:hypothetical protein
MSGIRRKRWAFWVLVAIVVAIATPVIPANKAKGTDEKTETRTSARESFTEWGRATRTVVPPTDEGVWDGTWYYVSRDFIIALWMKTENGKPVAKLQYSSLSSSENFVTDWDGKAEYDYRQAKGKFALDFERRDKDVIEGTWDWTLDVGKSQRIQEGDYRLYRTGDGRFMVMEFVNFERRIQKPGADEVAQADPAWTFKKASKRLVLWDELPF